MCGKPKNLENELANSARSNESNMTSDKHSCDGSMRVTNTVPNGQVGASNHDESRIQYHNTPDECPKDDSVLLAGNIQCKGK